MSIPVGERGPIDPGVSISQPSTTKGAEGLEQPRKTEMQNSVTPGSQKEINLSPQVPGGSTAQKISADASKSSEPSRVFIGAAFGNLAELGEVTPKCTEAVGDSTLLSLKKANPPKE